MYLLDTNVISEARKGHKANAGVQAFWQQAVDSELYLSVITIGEIRRGIENLKYRGDYPQAGQLEHWLMQVCSEFSSRILAFDLDCAQVWGRLMSPNPQHAVDKQITAIALIYDLVVVTRNSQDFASLPVTVHNPFSEQ
ncbi:type II toxin-antitoxin system VapC family toxin [Neisseriaceae bacterium TC5R-5]|nr:type II toxin-antitoxin system VapC family toxin [Neisseriaceae bacterium TC5R-5]